LAQLIQYATKNLVERLRVQAYNIVLRLKPRVVRDWHWHAEILPLAQTWGGLERNTQTQIVEVALEQTARELRQP